MHPLRLSSDGSDGILHSMSLNLNHKVTVYLQTCFKLLWVLCYLFIHPSIHPSNAFIISNDFLFFYKATKHSVHSFLLPLNGKGEKYIFSSNCTTVGFMLWEMTAGKIRSCIWCEMTVIYYKSVSSGFLEELLNKNIMHKAYHLYLCCIFRLNRHHFILAAIIY